MGKGQGSIKTEIDMAPTKINDQFYYTVKQFALLTNHSEQAIRRLIKKGNKVRQLFAHYFADKPFIPVHELKAFPFTLPGASEEVYHYGE